MTQFNVTNGVVSVEDGLKGREDYAPPRKAKVELSFSIPEGSDHDAHIQGVADLAQAHLHRLLHKVAAAPTTAPKDAPAPEKAVEKPAPAKPRTKADMAAEMGLPTTDTVVKAPADDLSDIMGDTPPAPVTDAELGKAAQEKNGSMKSVPGWAPEKIRDLIGKFVMVDGKPKPGARLQEVPANQRHDFLTQLKALK